MARVSKDNFGYLGIDFQYRLIKIFIEDHTYFIDYNSIINQNAFTDTYLKTVVGVIKEYYAKYDSVPSYETLNILLRKKAVTEDDIQFYDETIDKIKRASIEGLEEVGTLAEHFFKQQEMLKISNKLKEIVGSGDLDKYEECVSMWDSVTAIRRRDADTFSPFENVDNDLSMQNIVAIPTGIPRLDEALGGGIDKGKIGLIIGAMGFGKTSMTTCIAANAAMCKCEANDYKGFKVLHIVFEDTPRDMRRKYISKVTQVETKDLSKNESTIAKVKEILANAADTKMINENVLIMRLPTGEKTASDIRNIIKQKKNEGFDIDLVIVDYFGCVKPENGMSKSDVTDRESATMRKFENMAAEFDVAMWIPAQGNRASIETELVTHDKVGGSISKNQIAHIVITVTRSVDDQMNNLATIALLKNRSGLGTLTLNGVYFNNGTCTIECEMAAEFNDALAYNEYAADKEEEAMENMVRNARGKTVMHDNR